MQQASEIGDRARRAIAHVERLATGGPLDPALAVTLNFHPDRLLDGKTVLHRLAVDGEYRNQFETGTSNGSLSPHPGGARWRWEHRAFDGAYDDAPAHERPKYGALNWAGRPIGGAPRFGSAHLRLHPDVLERTTFCFPDSVSEPADVGTAERCALVGLARTFSQVSRTDAEEATVGGLLDDYVEAQVHGRVRLDRDVAALVLDPCFRGTQLETEAAALGVPVEWHDGRRLTVAELSSHPDFRGAHVVTAGRRIAEDGVLDARIVGVAARAGLERPDDIKRVWHCIARFGAPTATTA